MLLAVLTQKHLRVSSDAHFLFEFLLQRLNDETLRGCSTAQEEEEFLMLYSGTYQNLFRLFPTLNVQQGYFLWVWVLSRARMVILIKSTTYLVALDTQRTSQREEGHSNNVPQEYD